MIILNAPSTLQPNRVHVSAYIEVRRGIVFHESELHRYVDSMQDKILPHLGFTSLKLSETDFSLAGSVSVKQNEHELLGKDYWTYFISLTDLHKVYKGEEDEQRFDRRGILKLRPVNEQLIFQLERRDFPKPIVTTLPRRQFYAEWHMMMFRLTRIQFAAGMPRTILEHWTLDEWRQEHMKNSEEIIEYIGENLIEYTLYADLTEVLQNPQML